MNFEDYKNTHPYPNKDDFKSRYYYHHGKLVARYHGKISEEESNSLELKACTRELVVNDSEYRVELDKYKQEEVRLNHLFYNDLMVDLGISNNPKRDKLYSLAWDRGHSEGYEAVYNQACELVELIED